MIHFMLVFSIKGRLHFNLIVGKREKFPHAAFLQSLESLYVDLMEIACIIAC